MAAGRMRFRLVARTSLGRAALLALLGRPLALSAQVAPAAVDPEPVLQIGATLGDAPEYALTQVAAIAVVGDSILVLDAGANEIRVFDHEGTYIGRIGKEGEGPGEFAWATDMRLVPEGVAVADLRLRRQSFFSLEGGLLRTEPLGQLGNQPMAGFAAMRGDVWVAESSIAFGSEYGAYAERMIVLTSPGPPEVDTIARYSTGYVPWRLPDSFGFLPIRTGSEGDWAVAGDSLLVVVSGEPPVLRWWRADQAGLTAGGQIELPVRPKRFTGDDRRDLLDRSNERYQAEGGQPLPGSVELSLPSYWGQLRGLVVSDFGECWIQHEEPRIDQYGDWFRISLSSGRVDRFALPVGFRLLAATRDQLYGYMLTELDVPVVTVFRRRHAPGG